MKSPRVLVYAFVAAIAAFAIGQTWPDLVSRAAYAIESGQASAAREQLRHVQDLSLVFQEVTKAIRPSVVNIRSIRKIEVDSRIRRMPFPGRGPFSDGPSGDDLFQWFFGPRMQPPGESDGQPYVQRGLGTGVIISADGYIVTNNHVVAKADEITVTLSDDRSFTATVVGTDEKTDLAVLKINAPGLLPAELGDSAAIEVGQWVLAMGNPFGLSQTVTAGIISAKGRANVGVAEYEDFIQTDAAINPGNSGGPLVNLEGQVIGINTAIATRSGAYQGVGFAIPSNMVRQIMESIIQEGKVVRGWLGVGIQNLNPDLAASFQFEGMDGVLIGDVIDDGPGHKAGLEPGDIVVQFDGEKVTDMNQFRHRVAATRPGTKAELEVFRDGARRTLSVDIGELESQSFFVREPVAPEELGMRLQNITPDVARQLRLKTDEQGVVVTQVEPGSIAEKAGIRAGDVIISVGGERIGNLTEFHRALADRDLDQGVRLRVKSDGMQRFVFLKR
jgi:serine protease Do